MKTICEDRRTNSNKKDKNMNKENTSTNDVVPVVRARVIKYPFVEIEDSILNLNYVQTAYPDHNGTCVLIGETNSEAHYDISYADFKKLIRKA